MSTSNLVLDQPVLPAEFYQNPYPFFHELRSQDPVHWSDYWNCWLITRYRDVVAVTRDWRCFSSVGRSARFLSTLPDELRQQIKPLEANFTTGLISSDPPNHTRLRGLVSKAFTPTMIESQRPQIEAIVNRLLDAVQDAGEMDLATDFAYLLPTTVLAHLLGVPLEHRDQFNVWVDSINFFFGSRRADPTKALETQDHLLALHDYFRQALEKRRKTPGEDLLTRLATVDYEGEKFSEPEILATCQTLLTAGYETTMSLVNNGIYWLLSNPDQLEKLKKDPSLITSAIEELVRYDSPVQRLVRVVMEDTEIDGRKIRKGQAVTALIGAANRDPEQFSDPDRLDITRADNKHIGFGFGIHFCIGAPLARVEAAIAISTLIRRFPNLRMTSKKATWRENVLIRIPEQFRVTF